MPIKLKLENHKGAAEMLDSMPANAARGVERAFWRVGRDLKAEVDRQVLRKPKTGRLYKVAGKRRRHRASAPEQSHANLSGTLRKSTGFKVGSKSMDFGYGAGRIRAPAYAQAIEFGRRDGLIKPRPTLRHAISEELGNTIEHLGHYVGIELNER